MVTWYSELLLCLSLSPQSGIYALSRPPLPPSITAHNISQVWSITTYIVELPIFSGRLQLLPLAEDMEYPVNLTPLFSLGLQKAMATERSGGCHQA